MRLLRRQKRPSAFCTLAAELLPGKYEPTAAHFFIRLLHEKGLLLRCFTQNIDTLEREAGLPGEAVVEAHGSFAAYVFFFFSLSWTSREAETKRIEVWMEERRICIGREAEVYRQKKREREKAKEGEAKVKRRAHCIDCKAVADIEKVLATLRMLHSRLYLCFFFPGKFSTTRTGRAEVPRCERCNGLAKPDIVFFGESLPDRFFELRSRDFPQADVRPPLVRRLACCGHTLNTCAAADHHGNVAAGAAVRVARGQSEPDLRAAATEPRPGRPRQRPGPDARPALHARGQRAGLLPPG